MREKINFSKFTDDQLIKELEKRKYFVVNRKKNHIFEWNETTSIVSHEIYEHYVEEDWPNKMKSAFYNEIESWIEEVVREPIHKNNFHDFIRERISDLEEEVGYND